MNNIISTLFNTGFEVMKTIKGLVDFIRYKAKNLVIGSIFNLFPIKKDKIVICSYFGKSYGDNGKYICEEIIKQNLEFDIVWLVDSKNLNNSQFPNKIRVVKYNSLEALYELSTASVWIDNSRKFFHPPKRKKQFYIQTWHGAVALKRIEKDSEKSLSKFYVNSAKSDSKMADLLISNSKFSTELYKKSFWYDGEILECGTPRCDILKGDNYGDIERIKCKLGLRDNVKLITYAPTFRKNENTDVYNIEWETLLKILKEKFGGEWKVLIRMHPNLSDKNNFMKYDSNIIDVTNYPDMYEILNISEILITDYSSSMFEFSYTKKGVFLYAEDLEEYIKDRDFYFKINSLPYPLARSNKQLFEIIEKFEYEEYNNKLTEFLNALQIMESGKASEAIVNKIKANVNM